MRATYQVCVRLSRKLMLEVRQYAKRNGLTMPEAFRRMAWSKLQEEQQRTRTSVPRRP